MQDKDEVTEPGPPRLLEGTPEVRALSELQVRVTFFAGLVGQYLDEARRNPLTDTQRNSLWTRILDVQAAFVQAAHKLEPPTPQPTRGG
jgi:hypothetical protein